MQKQNQEIVLYGEPNGAGKVEVLLKNETLWLNLMQLATLFGRDKSVISRHLRNIYIDGELDERATVAKFATVQKEGSREIEREIEYYNLDAIISVGYRVNSKLGTRFRIWATTVWRDHIMKGYSINESRLKETTARAHELERAVRLIRAAADGRQLKSGEARGLLTVITEYAHSWSLLQQFDEEQIKLQRTRTTNFKTIAYDEACAAIVELKRHVLHKKEAGSLFGAERAGRECQADDRRQKETPGRDNPQTPIGHVCDPEAHADQDSAEAEAPGPFLHDSSRTATSGCPANCGSSDLSG